jgi:hypothetical protein
MKHVYWVIDHVLAGRPGPSLYPWDPEALYAGGIRAVVSLAAEDSVEGLEAYGFVHYRAEFPPVLLFSEGMRKAFIYQALPVWAFIHGQLTEGNPTLVHCYAGKDRTGAILGGYLVTYRGMTPEAAMQTVRAVRPTAMLAEGFAQVLDHLKPGELPDSRTLL